jgi:hypothetical protein
MLFALVQIDAENVGLSCYQISLAEGVLVLSAGN